MSRRFGRLFYYVLQIHGAGSAELAKKQLDWQCYYQVKKGAIFTRDTTWTNASQMGPEEWYEMYVRPFHPELALVGMREIHRSSDDLCLFM